jgi:hypothetical protein
MHVEKPFVPEPNASEVEVAIGKMKRYKSPGVDHIQAELIPAGGEILNSEIRKLIVDVDERSISSPAKRINFRNYSHKG